MQRSVLLGPQDELLENDLKLGKSPLLHKERKDILLVHLSLLGGELGLRRFFHHFEALLFLLLDLNLAHVDTSSLVALALEAQVEVVGVTQAWSGTVARIKLLWHDSIAVVVNFIKELVLELIVANVVLRDVAFLPVRVVVFDVVLCAADLSLDEVQFVAKELLEHNALFLVESLHLRFEDALLVHVVHHVPILSVIVPQGLDDLFGCSIS